jgi:hypothetical protein
MFIIKKAITNNYLIVAIMLSMLTIGFAPAHAEESPNNFSLLDLPGLNVAVDLKALQTDGGMGIDYNLSYDLLGDNEDRMDFMFKSDGYISSEKTNSNNSIVSQIFFSKRFFSSAPISPLSDKQKARLTELSEIGAERDLTAPESYEFGELTGISKQRSYFMPEAHFKMETDQRFTDEQYAAGVGVAFDLERLLIIKKILDFPFALLRPSSSYLGATAPRFYLGYDYVTDSDVEARKNLTDDDAFSRLTGQFAWKTYIFRGMQFKAVWQLYYEIDAPNQIEDADLDQTSFIEVMLSIPTNLISGGQAIQEKVFLKYSEGRLPPTLESDTQVTTGFSVYF